MTTKRKLAPLPRVTSKTITVGALLRKIQRLILAEPKRADMSRFVMAFGGSVVDKRYRPTQSLPACRTVACMAGWGAILLRPERTSGVQLNAKAEDAMIEAVGIDLVDYCGDAYRDVEDMFDPDPIQDEEWPMPLAGTLEHAQFIAKRIDTYLSQHPEIVNRKIIVADVQKALRA